MPDQVLTIEAAAKRFGENEALAGVHLELAAGECVALLGPNGAGKTTLVRAVAGRIALDAGHMALLGRSLQSSDGEAASARRRLGVVPQEIALYPLLSARENLEAFGALAGLRGGLLAERVAWALSWTGLETRADEPTRQFSGGMKRRLNLAGSVLHRPDVLLLDEPTVGVDPQSRERIWRMLDELTEQDGTALLLTTHQLDEAESVADRIVILDRGRVIAEGTLRELIANTVGRSREVKIILEDRAEPEPSKPRTHELVFAMTDVATELAAALETVRKRGDGVADVQIRPPSLQAVFMHLTGRELRD